jgi:hypothetical protein
VAEAFLICAGWRFWAKLFVAGTGRDLRLNETKSRFPAGMTNRDARQKQILCGNNKMRGRYKMRGKYKVCTPYRCEKGF